MTPNAIIAWRVVALMFTVICWILVYKFVLWVIGL